MIVVTCVNCQAEFEAARKTRMYCSKECQGKYVWAKEHPRVEERAPCPVCGADMSAKRAHAVYCSKPCKVRSSDLRRNADGRSEERDRERYANEAEHRRAYARQYLKDNPERMRAIRRKRKGQLKGQRFEFTERDWRRMKHRYHYRCAYCGQKRELIREHIYPLARGGRHSVGNILPVCSPCNSSKKTRVLSDWRYRVLPKRLGVIARDSS